MKYRLIPLAGLLVCLVSAVAVMLLLAHAEHVMTSEQEQDRRAVIGKFNEFGHLPPDPRTMQAFMERAINDVYTTHQVGRRSLKRMFLSILLVNAVLHVLAFWTLRRPSSRTERCEAKQIL